jgi:hypothetical protein
MCLPLLGRVGIIAAETQKSCNLVMLEYDMKRGRTGPELDQFDISLLNIVQENNL